LNDFNKGIKEALVIKKIEKKAGIDPAFLIFK
jgi:hypothetical protein